MDLVRDDGEVVSLAELSHSPQLFFCENSPCQVANDENKVCKLYINPKEKGVSCKRSRALTIGTCDTT